MKNKETPPTVRLRSWDRSNNTMIYSDDPSICTQITAHGINFYRKTNTDLEQILENTLNLMRCSEIKDVKGIYVYEEDIVMYDGQLCYIHPDIYCYDRFWLIYNDGKHYDNCHISKGVWGLYGVEVLGNLKQNPQLVRELKGLDLLGDSNA